MKKLKIKVKLKENINEKISMKKISLKGNKNEERYRKNIVTIQNK